MATGFDKELNARTRRVLGNFNKKVLYNKYKTRGRGILPATVSIKSFKDKYYDKPREEIVRQLDLYEKFSERNALDKTEGNRLSRWERNYFEVNREKTRQFYKDEIADLERIIGGQPQYHLRIHERLVNLKDRQKELDKDLSLLNDDQIKGLRSTYNYAERSELVKRQGFQTYLAQLERTMDALGYTQREINDLLEKFYALSENEFTEMVRNEDLIDAVYYLIDSPKGKGQYQLMINPDDENAVDADGIVQDIINNVDDLVKKYKTSE